MKDATIELENIGDVVILLRIKKHNQVVVLGKSEIENLKEILEGANRNESTTAI
ncbi:hypothetical protein [Terrihalobacillus insolitus]|uniref:hypothetical protein n=1 Tax=Terrihalobacillus insolitus TaxID=2950438 RepID=UPI00234004B6|nr:hypothetical protein [Terrihalobacillus insolitus]MDC3414298.1 hypothetical protein [Terrihalobacillus insolitus]